MEMNYKGTQITGTPQEFKEFLGEKKNNNKKPTIKLKAKNVGRGKGDKKKVTSRMKSIHRIAKGIKKEHPKMKYIDCVKKASIQYKKVHK